MSLKKEHQFFYKNHASVTMNTEEEEDSPEKTKEDNDENTEENLRIQKIRTNLLQ